MTQKSRVNPGLVVEGKRNRNKGLASVLSEARNKREQTRYWHHSIEPQPPGSSQVRGSTPRSFLTFSVAPVRETMSVIPGLLAREERRKKIIQDTPSSAFPLPSIPAHNSINKQTTNTTATDTRRRLPFPSAVAPVACTLSRHHGHRPEDLQGHTCKHNRRTSPSRSPKDPPGHWQRQAPPCSFSGQRRPSRHPIRRMVAKDLPGEVSPSCPPIFATASLTPRFDLLQWL